MPPKGSQGLYDKAVEIHKTAYFGKCKTKEEYKRKTGFMLQNLFGKGVWTLKDLNDEQLNKVIEVSQQQIDKKAGKPKLDEKGQVVLSKTQKALIFLAEYLEDPNHADYRVKEGLLDILGLEQSNVKEN